MSIHALLLSASLLCPLPAMAAPTDIGTVSGRVRGPDGAHLPGVVVTFSIGDDEIARVVSDDIGGFRLSALAAGTYNVRAELTGFRAATTTVAVAPNRITPLDLTLALETLAESIVVVADLPRDTVESTRLGESGARDVGEALTGTPGLTKVRRGAIANDIVLRGYQGENVTVLVDGVRLYGACPNNMDHPAFHVDFAEVDRIEVGKGPFDIRNQGALGGIVNIVTKRPGNGFHATPQLAFGSFGYINPSATASFGSDRFAVLGGYSYRTSNGYDDGSGRPYLSGANYRASALDGRAFEVNTGWARADVQPAAAHGIDLSVTRQAAGTVLYPYLQMDAVYDRATRAKAAWKKTGATGAIETLQVEAYLTRVDHSMTDERRTSSAASPAGYSMETVARTSTLGVKAEANGKGLTIGGEAYSRDWSAETRLAMLAYRPQYSVPDTQVTAVGAYAEYSRAIAAALRVDVGGRLDRVEASADPSQANTLLYSAYHGTASTAAVDTYPTGKARVSWATGSRLVLSGGVGRTARVPDPQERYFALARSGSDWVGNPDLGPTSNTGVDVALTWRHPRVFVNATAHHDGLGDYITVYQQARLNAAPGVMNKVARSYASVAANMSGGEVDSVVSVTDRLFVAADASLTRGRQAPQPAIGIGSSNIAEIPPWRTRVAVRYDLQRAGRGMFAEAEVIHAGAQHDVNTDVRETATPSYTVVNCKVGGSVRALRFALGLGNLFDVTYAEHLSYQRDPFRSGVKVYEPGRNVYGNVTMTF